MDFLNNIKNKKLIIMLGTVIILLIMGFIIFVPIRLNVGFLHPFLENQKAKKEDLVVTMESCVGLSYNIGDDYLLFDKYVQKSYMTSEIPYDHVDVKEVHAIYTGETAYDWVDINKSNISAYVILGNGARIDLNSEDILNVTGSKQAVTVKTTYGTTQLEINRVKIVKYDAKYTKPLHYGEKISKENISITAYYENNTNRQAQEIDYIDPGYILKDQELGIQTEYGYVIMNLECIPVDTVTYDGEFWVDDTITINEVLVKYKDNYETIIPCTSNLAKLVYGDNSIPVKCEFGSLSATVHAKEHNIATDAVYDYADEVRIAKYTYFSDTTYIATIEDTLDMHNYYITHIIVFNPSQIRLIKNTNAPFTIYGSISENSDGIIIDNNIKKSSSNYTNGQEIMLTKGGLLYTPEQNIAYEQLFGLNILDSIVQPGTTIIKDGQYVDTIEVKTTTSIIAMVESGEYYYINAIDPQKPINIKGIINKLLQKGCTYARCLNSEPVCKLNSTIISSVKESNSGFNFSVVDEYDSTIGKDTTINIDPTQINKYPIVTLAYNYIDKPYVEDGTDLETGVNSYMFISQLYRQYNENIYIPIDNDVMTTGQFDGGINVDFSNIDNLIPGDIIWYIDHAALYIGNDKVIYSSKEQGKVIIEEGIKLDQAINVTRILDEIVTEESSEDEYQEEYIEEYQEEDYQEENYQEEYIEEYQEEQPIEEG